MLVHWKTTALGVGSILTGLGLGLTSLADGSMEFGAAIAAIVAGVGLLTAADATA